MKQIVINFSELNDEAKKKYLRILAEKNVNLENQVIVKTSMPQQHRARLYSTNDDIVNNKAFTPARSTKQVSYHVKSDHSVGTKFSELEESYSKIMNKIQNKDLLSRPLKLSLNELSLLIEEIYQRKFIEDSNLIAKNQKVPEIMFNDYVYEFLIIKFKHSKNQNQQIINFLASIDLYSVKRKDIKIFQQFLKTHKQEVLTFFLFTRAVIQKELKLQFYHPLRKQSIDFNQIQLNCKQVQQISQLLYGSPDRYQDFKKYMSGNTISVSDFSYASITIYETLHQTHKQKPFQQQQQQQQQYQQYQQQQQQQQQTRSISPLQYNSIVNTNETFEQRQPDSPLFMQSETTVDCKQQTEPFFSSINQSQNTSSQKKQVWRVQFRLKKMKDPQNVIQKLINQKLELKLSDFLEDMLSELDDWNEEQKKGCVNEIEDKIEETVVILLDAIYKFDKLIWFKKLNKQPDEKGLEYIENLQKMYRTLVKAKEPLEDQLEQICTQMMQTPDLAKHIGNELLQYFYNLE